MSRQNFDKLRIDIWIHGTCDHQGNGGFACLLQSFIKGKRYSKMLGGYGTSSSITRMNLKALHTALQQIKNPSILHIYTNSPQVSAGVNKHMYQWAKKDWKTQKGELVRHADLWQDIYDILENMIGHKVHYQKDSPNPENNMRIIHRSSEYASQARQVIYEVVC